MSSHPSCALCVLWPTNLGVSSSRWLNGLMNKREALARHASVAAAKRHTSARWRFAGAASAPASSSASAPALTPAPSSSSGSAALQGRLRPEPSAASISGSATTRPAAKQARHGRCCRACNSSATTQHCSNAAPLLARAGSAAAAAYGHNGSSPAGMSAGGARPPARERASEKRHHPQLSPPPGGVRARACVAAPRTPAVVLVKSRCQAGTPGGRLEAAARCASRCLCRLAACACSRQLQRALHAARGR